MTCTMYDEGKYDLSILRKRDIFLFMTHREDWRMTLHSMNTESLRMEPGLSLDRQMSRKSVI